MAIIWKESIVLEMSWGSCLVLAFHLYEFNMRWSDTGVICWNPSGLGLKGNSIRSCFKAIKAEYMVDCGGANISSNSDHRLNSR